MRLHKFKALVLTVFTALFISCGSGVDAPNHHALVILSHFNLLKSGTNRVVPFEVNLLALYLLEHRGLIPGKRVNPGFDSIKEQCRNYIQWYLNHTNPNDQFQLTGTISDYDISKDGKESVVEGENDICASAASFILLVEQFQRITGYKQMFSGARLKIENVAYLIPHIQDPEDGLIPMNPKSTRKRLDTNCIAYAGMDAYLKLIARLGWDKEAFYMDSRDSIKIALFEHLYRPKHGSFYYMQEGKGNHVKKYAVDWSIFYPDSYAHLFPLLYKIMPLEETKNKRGIWVNIVKHHRSSIADQDLFKQLMYKWTAESMNQNWLESPGGY